MKFKTFLVKKQNSPSKKYLVEEDTPYCINLHVWHVISKNVCSRNGNFEVRIWIKIFLIIQKKATIQWKNFVLSNDKLLSLLLTDLPLNTKPRIPTYVCMYVFTYCTIQHTHLNSHTQTYTHTVICTYLHIFFFSYSVATFFVYDTQINFKYIFNYTMQCNVII